MTLAIYPLVGTCEDSAFKKRRRPLARAQHGNPPLTASKDSGLTPPADDMAPYLVAIAAHADMAAFEALFEQYSPRIRAYMLKLTRNGQAAEDLMQETMLTIWRKAGQFDPARGPASAWIFTIARNIWIDAWRKQRRPEFNPEDPAFVSEPLPDAARVMEDRQSHDALHRALATLPKEQVDLIRLSFFEEASHSTIAKQLGLPIGAVKSRIRLAFGRLRTALESLR